jgi:eukaryotic-like serine/threonine-protein kinase
MPDLPDNSDRWADAERLFHEALDQPAQARIEFLNRACGADTEMRREVESLLGHHSVGDSLLERPALAHAGWIAPAWTAGTVVGSYRIVERLGGGGMGEVFRARDTRLGRDVALKTVAPAQDPSYLERLRREARVLASLNHPNVATLYGIEESDGAFALAMELVEGETLTQRMAKSRMKPADFLAIAIEIAEAVEAAHRRDVIHRDLKPGNVMITRAGKVKVLDFGLAKRSEGVSGHPDDATQTAAPTSAGTVLGTVGYMSPEQAEGRDVDSRSDIFSFVDRAEGLQR